ncbi:MAG: CD225/dispanin family protein [Thermoguttaceae bacterium]
MPIEFRCTQCDKLLRTGDETAGKQAKCPECGAFMAVPGGEAAWAESAEPSATPPPPSSGSDSPFASGGGENPYQSPGQANSPHGTTPAPGSVPNNLVFAILVTFFCCMPFGIVAIIFAAQVNGKLAGGDYQGAVEASNNAKTWCLVALGCGLISYVPFMLLMCSGVAVG